MCKFIMVKAITTLHSIAYMEESYKKDGEERFFPITSENDKVTVRSLEDREYPIYILVFREIERKKQVECIYSGIHLRIEDDKEADKVSIFVSIKQKLTNQSIIENYVSCAEIDLTYDFSFNSYVTVESSPSFVKQMNFIASPPYRYTSPIEIAHYIELEEEKHLHPLAQRNEYCKRVHVPMDIDNDRGEFRRDLERIIHSKAFRSQGI